MLYLLFFVFFLILVFIFRLFYVEIKKLKKINAGLTHVLEKSEKNRINAEKLKNQFISTAVHQLKAPLSAVRLSIKMLIDQDFGKINSQQQNILEKTYKNNESLISLVDDFLKEARENRVDQPENASLINLEDLIVSVIDFYKDEMKKKKINFTFVRPRKKSPEVLVNQKKITIVIQNLFDNAVKYTRLKGRIEVELINKNNEVEFKIKDSGIGIPENQKAKIFKKFSRATNAVKSKATGSGLGLAIAKDIIEKHHGKIWFESRENEGSTFFFSLPFAKQ